MTPSSPYRGLAPFEDSELDALFFFGREHDSEIVVANLIASRFTVLYGPSGVGKSSLLLASVARKLRELPEEPLVVVFSSWTADPQSGLAAAIGEGEGPLLEVVERAQAERDVYLILDQAEEYFVYHGEDAAFEEALAELVTRPLRVNVLLSLREDTLARLDRLKALIPNLFGNVLRLDRLDRASGRAAIVRPLERWGELHAEEVTAEASLVDDVLDGVGTGRIELGPTGGGPSGGTVSRNGDSRIEAPYLQLVMQRLWEVERAAGSTTLRAATLAGLGGAGQVVADHLERAIDALTPEQQAVAAVLFDHLVTPSGTKIAHEASDLAQFTGRPEAEVRPVLATLVEHRILRTDEGGRYEIFHDVLAAAIVGWTTRYRAERAVATERRRRRRAVALAVAALVALAGMTAVAVYALEQRGEAREQARAARSRELAAAALSQMSVDPERALAIALRAAELEQTARVDAALRQGLLESRLRRALPLRPAATHLVRAANGNFALTTDGSLVVVDRELHNQQRHRAAGRALAVSPEDVLVSTGRELELRRLADGRVRSRFPLAAGSRRPIFNVTTGDLVGTTRIPRQLDLGAIGPGGTLIAVAGGRRIVVLDARTGKPRYEIVQPSPVTALAFGIGARLLASGGADGNVRLWRLESGTLKGVLRGRRGAVRDIAFSPRGTWLAVASNNGTARVWRLGGGDVSVLTGHQNPVLDVEWSPDGTAVATASADGTASVWKAATGGRLATMRGPVGTPTAIEFTADGSYVVTASDDGTVRLWDARAQPELQLLARFPRPVERISTSAGRLDVTTKGRQTYVLDARGRRLGSGRVTDAGTPRASEGAVALVEGDVVRVRRSGVPDVVLRGHRRPVTSAHFSADGSRVVTASADTTVRIWDASSGEELQVLRGHFGTVADAALSPDGRWIVSAGPAAAGLWDVDSGRLVFYLRGHEGALTAAAFDPSGRRIITGGEDGTVRVYDCEVCLSGTALISAARRRLAETGRTLNAVETARYLGG